MCMRPMTAPRSRRRATKRSGSSASSSSASSQPSRALGTKRCTTPKRGVHELALVLVPPAELGDVGEAALGEEAQHLELGVVARLDAAERLQHELVVEDDRGVGLLGADRAHVGAGPRRLDALEPVELDAGVLAVHLGAVAQQAAEQLARARVGERVVDRDAPNVVDDRVVEAVRSDTQQQLVDVVRAARVARLDQRRGQRRRAWVGMGSTEPRRGRGSRPRRAPWSRTSGGRAATRRASPRRAWPGQRLPSVSSISASGSSLSRNQNKPRGASVSR